MTSDYDQKVIGNFFDGNRLESIPAKRKKRDAVLRHLINAFERERVYREAQVNQVLLRFHEDFATLRRELVDAGMLVRRWGEYGRPD